MENDKTFTRVTRSSSKKLATESKADASADTRLKKSRVTLQLDFGEGSPTARSPALKKPKDGPFNSKMKKEKCSLLADMQSLLNLAAKHGCLSYLELPKVGMTDSDGNVRAHVPKQLENIPGIESERPILRKDSKNPSRFAIIRPDAPTMIFNGTGFDVQKKEPKIKLDFLLVIDFESTCWDRTKCSAPPPNEIIEFPAVLVNLKTGEIVDKFQQYVMPMEQPQLSEFCTNLTGISQAQVNSGVPLNICIELFLVWLDSIISNNDLTLYHNGNKETQDAPNSFAFATWTDWDFKKCLKNECLRKNIKFPAIFSQWIDLKAAFQQTYGWHPKSLKGAVDDVGLTFEGRAHSGLCDAINTAKLAHQMVCGGSNLNRFSEI